MGNIEDVVTKLVHVSNLTPEERQELLDQLNPPAPVEEEAVTPQEEGTEGTEAQ